MTVRRISAAEWREVRDLRLLALADPDASLAFLGTIDQARGESEEFWRDRAANSSMGPYAAQFVFESEGGWLGTATALRQVEGAPDELGHPRPADRVIVVGMFVDPIARGSGAVDALLNACADWAKLHDFDEIFLNVHTQNSRAIRAYDRNGFVDTGLRFESIIGPEQEMVRAL